MSIGKLDRSFLNFALSLYVPSFFIQLGWGLVTPIMPLYARSFGIPYALVAMVTTANAIGRLCSDIPLGTIADRKGRRPLTIIGPLLVVVSAIFSGLAQSFYELLAYRVLTGIGMSMWMIARQAMIADSVDPSIRGRVISTFQGVNMLGSAAGPAVGGIIAELWGIRSPFFFYAGSTFVSFLACLFFIKETMPKHQEGRERKLAQKVNVRTILGLLTFPIMMAAFTNFTNHIRFAARGVLIPIYGGDVLCLTTGEIGLVLSASTFANLLMVIPGGYIVDKWGRKAGLVPAFVLTGAIFALFPFAKDFTSITIVSALIGVASGIGGGATMAIAADLAPEDFRGFFMGFWTTIGDIGSAVGPVIIGLVADMYQIAMSFYVTAFLMFLTAATTQLFVKETLKKEPIKEKGAK